MPLVAGWCLTYNVVDVDLTGNYAYLTDGDYLRTVNVSDPSHPQHAARFEQPGTITAVTISGNIAVVGSFQDVDTAWVSKVTLYNISNPDSLIRLEDCDLPDVPQDFEVRDSLIFVADQIGGLRILHCGNPESIYEISSVTTPDFAFGVKLSGNYAYVADYQRGLRVISIQDPVHPLEIGFYDTPGFSMDVDVDGAYAYVADYTSGLRIIDVSNPVNPHEVGFLDTPGTMSHVVKSGIYAYLADYSEGIRIVNVSNSLAPHEVGYYNTQGNASRITVNGNHLFVADGGNLGIYDCSQALGVVDRVGDGIPQECSLKQNYPNPFNATTTIEYTIPKTGAVDLKLYDVSGREVATLVNFHQNPGMYTVTFDGKSLSTGTYFLRLQSGNFTQTSKLLLLK
ncbi:MAG: T9SS type A sorting domain-containing protein [bacterium]|nr:T9SS type A sorting domain-containing protein [bacterium]